MIAHHRAVYRESINKHFELYALKFTLSVAAKLSYTDSKQRMAPAVGGNVVCVRPRTKNTLCPVAYPPPATLV
jgi:hypothetical protein